MTYNNGQLRISTAQLDEANVFLETVLTSLQAGVAVVDPDLPVRIWNQHAENLWGLRAGEVTEPGHCCAVRWAPTGRPRRSGSTVNRRGRTITVRVACTPLRGCVPAGGDGVVVVMETA